MIKKWERIDILLLIMLILAFLSVILTGCATLSQADKDYYNKQFKDFKDHHNEPQVPDYPTPRP